ncbi:MAG: dihydrofolate reductase [Cyclonatronaceae bacterium]
MIISMIAAHDPDLVIGRDGTLPWHIPEDLAHFKKRTRGHAVVMGRSVFEELGEKPLPDRRNIVMSRSKTYGNVQVCRSRDEVLELLDGENKIYVIGGEKIYRLFYPICHRLEITIVKETYPGDTFFPEYRNEIGTVWKEVSREERDEIIFVDYERI